MAAIVNWWNKQPKWPEYPQVDEEQQHNPFKEVRLLCGHQSIVAIVKSIDKARFISASMDSVAIVWDAEMGTIIGRLLGHKSAITSILVMPAVEEDPSNLESEELDGDLPGLKMYKSGLIITAALDGINIWTLPGLDGGDEPIEPKRRLEEEAVECLKQVNRQMFCSGGASICLWNTLGDLLCRYEAKGLLNIRMDGMLCMKSFELTIVALSTLSNEKSLDVWYIHTPETSSFSLSSHKKRDYNISYKKAVLTPHSGKICHLCEVSDLFFATRCHSTPSQVILWSTKTVTRVMLIDLPSSPRSPSKGGHLDSRQHVTCLVPLMQKYLVIGIENGFQIYNIAERSKGDGMRPQLLLEMLQGPGQSVVSACVTGNGHILATATNDGRIKFWSASKKSISFQTEGNLLQGLNDNMAMKTRDKLFLVGDVQWHLERIKNVCSVTAQSFVASGSENELVFWMSQEYERLREEELAGILKQRGLL